MFLKEKREEGERRGKIKIKEDILTTFTLLKVKNSPI
jgi:hypothetical protein